jgi:hypothetical protein
MSKNGEGIDNESKQVDSEGFWRWCMTGSIIGRWTKSNKTK